MSATWMCAKSFNSPSGRGICHVRQAPGARGNHDGPHYDADRRVWDESWTPETPEQQRARERLRQLGEGEVWGAWRRHQEMFGKG